MAADVRRRVDADPGIAQAPRQRARMCPPAVPARTHPGHCQSSTPFRHRANAASVEMDAVVNIFDIGEREKCRSPSWVLRRCSIKISLQHARLWRRPGDLEQTGDKSPPPQSRWYRCGCEADRTHEWSQARRRLPPKDVVTDLGEMRLIRNRRRSKEAV
jgi:hypothetical protein